ncbi:MAG: pilus assembly protein PilM [Sedimentisphaerales bacterium]|nr:pilus assembly protein PilM [Sedimentisphaerales bacterium]
MLNYFRKKIYPIGIDLGSKDLKLIQLALNEGKLYLMAAAKAAVPQELVNDPLGLQNWYIANIKRLLTARPFKGKKVVTCLPTRSLLIQHLRLPKMDEDQLGKTLKYEAQEKLPFSTSGALLRHITAGEVYEAGENKLEVVLMAASRNVVQQHLQIVEHANIEIESVNVEACALLNAFSYLSEHNGQDCQSIMLVDLGHTCVKVVVAHGRQMAFCRSVKYLSETDQAVPVAQTACQSVPSPDNTMDGVADTLVKEKITLPVRPVETSASGRANLTDDMIIERLGAELRSCARYHDLVFQNMPIARVIFLGGKAKDKQKCQNLAKSLGLPAQLGDPIARIEEDSRFGPHSDLEPERNNSDWAVAFGLSINTSD